MTDKDKLQDIISERLRSERESMRQKTKNKVTQAEVARAVGLSRSHLAAAESGHTLLSLEALIQLAGFYNVSLDSLVGLTPSRQSDHHPMVVQTAEEAAFLRALRAMNETERQSLTAFFARLLQQVKAA
ncbi:helix-turn-helix transcriptional regulator [Acetobacteraceae bacterium ESL0709]|nr:helix-turn-helix transcriptional regulator [Acetobacteraceae bacterium ESL0697]MDF7678136.1 helix-turn-helix transcriptional regulator [Acetobacteraceae bacterium ESL0709]